MFISDGDLEAVVEAAYKVNGRLGTYWYSTIIPNANAAAYSDIVGRLLGRGFTKAQIDSWDRGPDFQKNIGLFWALTNGGALEAFSDTYIRALDRRRELETIMAIEISGVWTKPGESTYFPGQVTTGSFDSTADMFVPIDSQDTRIGSPMQW